MNHKSSGEILKYGEILCVAINYISGFDYMVMIHFFFVFDVIKYFWTTNKNNHKEFQRFSFRCMDLLYSFITFFIVYFVYFFCLDLLVYEEIYIYTTDSWESILSSSIKLLFLWMVRHILVINVFVYCNIWSLFSNFSYDFSW